MIELIIGIVALLTGIGVVMYFVTIYNSLIRLNKNIDKAWSNINVLLKQRHEELPKLLSTVKGYMRYEKKLLKEITSARTAYSKAKTKHDKAVADARVSAGLMNLFAVAENYPKLMASENFKHLQERISGLENELADRREFYNDSVNEFNIRIKQIPDVIIAQKMGYKEKELFKVTAAEKKDIKIKF